MKRYFGFTAMSIIALASSPEGKAQSHTAEVLNEFQSSAPSWPKAPSFGKDWKEKIDRQTADQSFVSSFCAEKMRNVRDATLSLKRVVHHEEALGLCYSTLDQATRNGIEESFRSQYGGKVLGFYIDADDAGKARLHYFMPSYECSVLGTEEITKNVFSPTGEFKIGKVTEFNTSNTGFGCHGNLKEKDRLGVNARVSLTKEVTKTVPFKDKVDKSEKLDLRNWITEAQKTGREPLIKVLNELETAQQRQIAEIEAKLKRRPLFKIPTRDSKEDNYAFVVDKTGSFKEFQGAMNQLIDSIQNYPENKSFSIALFGTTAGDNSADSKRKDVFEKGALLKATAQNRARVIEWLKVQQTEGAAREKGMTDRKAGQKTNESKIQAVSNEYASDVLKEIQASNPGKPVSYQYYGDGTISINSDSTTAPASVAELNRQRDFVQGLGNGASFAFLPLSKKYDPNFVKAMGSKMAFVDPTEAPVSAREYLETQSNETKKLIEIKGDWEVIKDLKAQYSSAVPYEEALAAIEKGVMNSERNYETLLTDISIKYKKLAPIITKYGERGIIKINGAEKLLPKEFNYYFQNDKTVSLKSRVRPDQACK